MTTISTLLIFATAIILVVVAIARWKVHPFLSILGTALLLAFLLGIPFEDIPDVIGKGFGGVASGIVLIIIFADLDGLYDDAIHQLADLSRTLVARTSDELLQTLIPTLTVNEMLKWGVVDESRI